MDTQTPTPEVPKEATKSVGTQIGGVVGAIVGIAVGRYCGFHLLIPLALAFGLGWLLTKIPASPAAFRGAWAVQAAHALWMGIAGSLTGAWSQVGLDIIVLIIGLVWLWTRPGLGPVVLLGVYQLAAAAINLFMLFSAETASEQHKALVAHLSLRAAAVAFLIPGYVKKREQQDSHTG